MYQKLLRNVCLADLSKTFDLLPHDLLLAKLHAIWV